MTFSRSKLELQLQQWLYMDSQVQTVRPRTSLWLNTRMQMVSHPHLTLWALLSLHVLQTVNPVDLFDLALRGSAMMLGIHNIYIDIYI